MEEYLNPKELAERLHTKLGTIYSWVSRGKVPYVKINGLTRFKQKEIEAWLLEEERERKRRNFTL
jgi:excisionase family DNA binding protein